MFATIQLHLFIAPAIVFAIVLIARHFGAAIAGFLAGLPYASAVAIYFIAAQHGDQSAVTAIASALLVKFAFLIAAVCSLSALSSSASAAAHVAYVPYVTYAAQVTPNARPRLSTAFIAAAFSFIVGYVADHYSAKSAGLLAGVPVSNLCIVFALAIKTNTQAVAQYVRGFVAGHLITIAFHASVFVLASHIGFQIAFVMSACAVATLALLRFAHAARTRLLQSQVSPR